MKQFNLLLLSSVMLMAFYVQQKPIGQQDYSKKIRSEAETMVTFLIKKNFNAFADYTYPKITEMMGGKEGLVKELTEGTNKMESEGYKFLSVKIGEPSAVIIEGNELQCTVPETVTMKAPNGYLVTKSTLIAVSTDKGKKWYFIDTSGKTLQSMQQQLPNLSSQLVFTPDQPPVFYGSLPR